MIPLVSRFAFCVVLALWAATLGQGQEEASGECGDYCCSGYLPTFNNTLLMNVFGNYSEHGRLYWEDYVGVAGDGRIYSGTKSTDRSNRQCSSDKFPVSQMDELWGKACSGPGPGSNLNLARARFQATFAQYTSPSLTPGECASSPCAFVSHFYATKCEDKSPGTSMLKILSSTAGIGAVNSVGDGECTCDAWNTWVHSCVFASNISTAHVTTAALSPTCKESTTGQCSTTDLLYSGLTDTSCKNKCRFSTLLSNFSSIFKAEYVKNNPTKTTAIYTDKGYSPAQAENLFNFHMIYSSLLRHGDLYEWLPYLKSQGDMEFLQTNYPTTYNKLKDDEARQDELRYQYDAFNAYYACYHKCIPPQPSRCRNYIDVTPGLETRCRDKPWCLVDSDGSDEGSFSLAGSPKSYVVGECDVTGEDIEEEYGSDIQCTACPSGTTGENLKTCSQCGAGKYLDQSGQAGAACKPCAAGTYAESSGVTACIQCAVHYYQAETGQLECKECTDSQQANSDRTGCISCGDHAVSHASGCSCKPGYGHSGSSTSVCKICPSGTFWSGYVSASVSASAELGSDEDHDACRACSVGQYQSEQGYTSSMCNWCRAGTYQDERGKSGCKVCSKGEFQGTTGMTFCYSCDKGTYSDQQGSTELSAASACKACTPSPPAAPSPPYYGLYQDQQGQSACSQCSDFHNRFQDEAGQSQCKLCQQAGGSCVCDKNTYGTLSTVCTICSAGTYCNGGETQIACAAGKFQNNEAKTECESCADHTSYYASDSGSGPFYQDEQGQSRCKPCSNAHPFVNAGRTLCGDNECTAGKYEGESAGALACIACVSGTGTYQDQSSQTQCKACTGSSKEPNAAKTDCVCKPGYGRPYDGTAVRECDLCAKGTYQSEDGVTVPCGSCVPGAYQDGTGTTACKVCVAGKYEPKTAAMTDCIACPLGTYQAQSGKAACKYCTEGHVPNLPSAAVSCTACAAGTYAHRDEYECHACPVGTYQPHQGKAGCVKCTYGTYSDSTGVAHVSGCKGCSLGTYQNQMGQSACRLCNPGTYSKAYAAGECQDAFVGYFVAGFGQPEEELCPSGNEALLMGMSRCTPCPAGKFYAGPNATALVLQGDYAEPEACVECARGTFQSEAGKTACRVCPKGKVSVFSGSRECACAPGKYAVSKVLTTGVTERVRYSRRSVTVRIETCYTCPPGEFQTAPGATECLPCGPDEVSADDGTACRLALASEFDNRCYLEFWRKECHHTSFPPLVIMAYILAGILVVAVGACCLSHLRSRKR